MYLCMYLCMYVCMYVCMSFSWQLHYQIIWKDKMAGIDARRVMSMHDHYLNSGHRKTATITNLLHRWPKKYPFTEIIYMLSVVVSGVESSVKIENCNPSIVMIDDELMMVLCFVCCRYVSLHPGSDQGKVKSWTRLGKLLSCVRCVQATLGHHVGYQIQEKRKSATLY